MPAPSDRITVIAVDLAGYDPPPEEYDAALALLQPESAARVRRFRLRADALRCLVGRLIPLYAAHEEKVMHPGYPLQVATTTFGRPYFDPPTRPAIDFNVSHDANLVVGCWRALETRSNSSIPSAGEESEGQVGVDVMRLGLPSSFPDYGTLVEALHDQLHPSELQRLAALLSDTERAAHLLRLWTHKESVAKLLGQGAALDLAQLAFQLAPMDLAGSPTAAARVTSTLPALTEAERKIGIWETQLVLRDEAYDVALAYRRRPDADGAAAAVRLRWVEVGEVLTGARAARASDG